MQLARPIGALALLCSLSGCADGMPSLLGRSDNQTDLSQHGGNFAQPEGETRSEVISTLLERRSLLAEGTIYNSVAEAAVAASARASEAELISAKLRAEAEAKNWLPTIGPSVSLTDLGELVAGMLIQQVLFDNGRRKAERDFAAADVEVAAVNLSVDMNERVEDAVGLYIAGLRGDEKSAYSSRALTQMQEFRRIVAGRVDGGLSNRADLNVVDSKISGMRNARTTAQDAAKTARAELTAMTGETFSEKPGKLDLGTPPADAQYLAVLKSQAQANRNVAQAVVNRAGLLPQIAAAGNITSDGSGAGLTLDLAEPLGLGTPAALQAIEASKEAARRQIGEAEEDARRSYARQVQRLGSYQRQTTEAATLARASRETYRLFKAQFEAGQRPVMDVVNIYEELVKREQDHIEAKYEVVLIQLALARDMGLLADGDKI
ncbi:TolC family protein [Pseudophaeobacter flagellatus]|uniref:TolC family protein n=1 Tax=Pseudophaeobacter flagellatus TaxID=2899119 RepID=UPI001E45BB27|nr:TolC family protein [Pseudophaeobacter flagellatus]MCD9150051.1 TolC family protein [Pseudophaeobacter flagellatus]